MFTCASCGCDGASHCTFQDDNGNAAGDYFHPVCLARKSIEASNVKEARDFGSVRSDFGTRCYIPSWAKRPSPAKPHEFTGGFVGTRPPYLKGPTVLQVRLRVGGMGQRASRTL